MKSLLESSSSTVTGLKDNRAQTLGAEGNKIASTKHEKELLDRPVNQSSRLVTLAADFVVGHQTNMNRYIKYIALPAVAPALIVGLYFTPVMVFGCVTRGWGEKGTVLF